MNSLDKQQWAEQFRATPSCEKCPFVKDAAGIGVGTIYNCDHVCAMEVQDILRYMGNMEGE